MAPPLNPAPRAGFPNSAHAEHVSLFDHFCSDQGCQTIVNGSLDNVITHDYGHLAAVACDSIGRSALGP